MFDGKSTLFFKSIQFPEIHMMMLNDMIFGNRIKP